MQHAIYKFDTEKEVKYFIKAINLIGDVNIQVLKVENYAVEIKVSDNLFNYLNGVATGLNIVIKDETGVIIKPISVFK